MKQSDTFNAAAIVREVAQYTDLLPEEVVAIEKRLFALAVGTKPPVWGYAGMLEKLCRDGKVRNVYDVYATVKRWIDYPDKTLSQFTLWNAARELTDKLYSGNGG